MLLCYNSYAFVIFLLSDCYTIASGMSFEYGKIEQNMFHSAVSFSIALSYCFTEIFSFGVLTAKITPVKRIITPETAMSVIRSPSTIEPKIIVTIV